MKYLSGPAVVSGVAPSATPIRLIYTRLPIRITVRPNARTHEFAVRLPEGTYRVATGRRTQEQTFFPAAPIGSICGRSGRST